MNTTISIRLDKNLDRELARLAKRTGRSKSELAREALRRQFAILRFRELRRQAMPQAEAAGYLTDEDVFRDIS
jgi:predicted transcriptional regulator